MMRSAIARLSGLIGAIALLLTPHPAKAQVALIWARVESLRNRVELIPQGRPGRPAQVSDLMEVGDALRTAQAARAEIRFNEGSLARIGERAIFRFIPNTRNFRLSNGTLLLLIPMGRGRSTIQTPNTVTGIQGSALFVRVDLETDTTLIGALTNNPAGPMMVYNPDGSQQQPLYAGEMVVVEGNQITHLYQFDLKTFYETSSIVAGLNLTQPDFDPNAADPIAVVQSETSEALASQKPLTGEGVIENPDFVRLTNADITAANFVETLSENFQFPTLPPEFGNGPLNGVSPLESSGLTEGQPTNPSNRPQLPAGLPTQTSEPDNQPAPEPPAGGNRPDDSD
ncbi:MAG: FecR family protein [Pseudanabaenales cyanobacterium]|nr:FecR family protein [Pseudanabaenales cyanobacterium]